MYGTAICPTLKTSGHTEIVAYQADDTSVRIEVILDNDTVWLTQNQMVELFNSTQQNISRHIHNNYREGELEKEPTHKEYLFVQNEGNRKVSRKVRAYNLDVIISVGYRVKSLRGTRFRIWANQVLKEYLLKGGVLRQRLDRVEDKLREHDSKFELLITNRLQPSEGIFFDGQVFDAYRFVAELIRSARKTIVLVDNYPDETTLLLLSKRMPGVEAKLYTAGVSRQFRLDLQRFNTQYPPVVVRTFNSSHDRFLIMDDTEIYQIGASLKDLGKKWFAIMKLTIDPAEILWRLEQKPGT